MIGLVLTSGYEGEPSLEFRTYAGSFDRYASMPAAVRGRVFANAPVYVLTDDGFILNPVHDMGAELEEWFSPQLEVE